MKSSAYCSANLEEGFKLLQSGHSVAEASKISGVPRTTLYSKARNCGVICLRENIKKYSEEQIEQAVKAVISKFCFKVLQFDVIPLLARWADAKKCCWNVWLVKNCPVEKITFAQPSQ